MTEKSGPSFTSQSKDVATALSNATVGLVSKAEFARRREEIEKAAQTGSAEASEKKKKAKKKAKLVSTLSFDDDEEAEEADDSVSKKPKLGKNPNVDTAFLPDQERDDAMQKKKDELARAWKGEQDKIKAEKIEVTYSYWDGKGHRYSMEVPKGFTVEAFLNKCREQVRELRNASPGDLMYVKEDLILPHATTFYELIVNKARGKSGPLFNFDVHDDVRMVGDSRVEKDESHAGKVMEKRLYERNKEKFPYSRFEVYDPTKKYDGYSIHGSETYGEGVNTALL